MNHLQTLTRYRAWADALVYSAVQRLPEAERVAPRPIIFGSIQRTLHHVLAMDEVWQAHLQGRDHGYTTRNPQACPHLVELTRRQTAINRWFIEFADGLGESARAEVVEFDFIGGGRGAMSREAILTHVVNHATYHRGHVADMLYHTSVAPPTTDLPVFLQRESDP